MASSPEYIDFICSQINGIGITEARKMFGDWCIYIDGKPVMLVCDNQCYVKMLPDIRDLVDEDSTGYPYEGAKEHYILDIGHRDIAVPVLKKLVQILPYPRKKKTSKQN